MVALGAFVIFSRPRSLGKRRFQDLGSRKNNDFLVEYTPMIAGIAPSPEYHSNVTVIKDTDPTH